MTSATDNRTACKYCDGFSNPKITGSLLHGSLLFCIRGTTLIMRSLNKTWHYPQWLLTVNYCPMCGRDLRRGDAR